MYDPTPKALIHWPESMVHFVRALRATFAFVSEYRVLGIPLDWPLRCVVLALLYIVLRRRRTTRNALVICSALLLAKELFDSFALQRVWPPRPPGWDDLADVLSGLAGIALGMLLTRRRPASSSRPASSDSHPSASS